MRLRSAPLAAALLFAASAAAHPIETCAAQAPQAPLTWTFDRLGSLGATSVSQGERGGVLVNRSRSTWSLDGPNVVRLGARWDEAAGAWEPVGSRDVIAFADPDRDHVATYTFEGRSAPSAPFVAIQRDVQAYDAEGREISDTRQDWTGTAWVDNRRVVYERHPSGAFRSLRFERWDGSAWALDYRATTAFDGDQRVLCELFDTDDAGAAPYLRYRTTYADGRPTAVVREDFRGGSASVDSSAYVYDAEGRYEALEAYDFTALGWEGDRRSSVVFDASGTVVEERVELPAFDGWRDHERTRLDYRADGLVEARTFERFTSGAWEALFRVTYTSERQATGREAPLAAAVSIVASPNPTAGLADVRLTLATAGPLAVDVFDVAGRRVASERRAAASGDVRVPLDLRGRPAGTYLVVVRTDAGRSTATVTLAR